MRWRVLVRGVREIKIGGYTVDNGSHSKYFAVRTVCEEAAQEIERLRNKENKMMEHFVTKEQVCHILKAHGHQVVMDSSFVVGWPINGIEAIVDVCDVIAKAAYAQGVKDTELHTQQAHDHEYGQAICELQEFNNQLRAENKELCEKVESLTKKNQNLFNSLQDKRELNESEELHDWLRQPY